MPIAEIPQMKELLSSISRVNPELPEYESIIISGELEAVFPDGSHIKKQPIYIWFKKDVGIPVNGLLQKIRKELDLIQHPSSEQIARTILLLLTFHPNQKIDGVVALNQILGLKTSSNVSQYHILQDVIIEEFSPIFFGDFSFDILDAKRLAYKCQKAGSNYYDLYENSLIRRPWIERKKFSTVIINCFSFLNLVKTGDQSAFVDSATYYFEAVASTLFDDFWFYFNEQQNFHISLGLGIIPDKIFREKVRSTALTIFQNILLNSKYHGHVVPIGVGRFEMAIPVNLGRAIKQQREDVEKQYSFPAQAEGEIYQTIKTFTKFIAKGYRYLEENKKDDGFLHFVIALDLLFGDKHESTKTVTNRSSLLTFGACGRSYNEQKKVLSNIYDLRSKYVHAGISVQDDYISKIQPICHEVLYCLLRLQKNNVKKDIPLTIELWKKKLDFAWSAIEANELLNTEFKLEIGLLNDNINYKQ